MAIRRNLKRLGVERVHITTTQCAVDYGDETNEQKQG
jgi:hypothetical protein